jgi:hypothetical protein
MCLPVPGDTKVETVDIFLRIRDQPKTVSFDQVYNAPKGWVIDSYALIENKKFGDSQGPSCVRCGEKADVASSELIQEKYDESNKLFASLAQKVQESAGNIQEKLDLMRQAQAEYARHIELMQSYSSVFKSSLEGLRITAKTKAVWKEILGIRIYSSGGCIDADVKITLRYIGNQSFLDAHAAQFAEQLNQIVNA